MSNIVPNARLGQVDIVKDDAYLGHVATFVDKNWSVDNSVEVLSSSYIYAAFVKNDSGGTLGLGLGVTFKANGIGKTIGALSGANAICDGIVDPFLSAAVPDESYFWLIIKGPVDILVGVGGSTAGDVLQTLANGLFTDATPGTNPIGHSGRWAETAVATERARAYFHNPFSTIQC